MTRSFPDCSPLATRPHTSAKKTPSSQYTLFPPRSDALLRKTPWSAFFSPGSALPPSRRHSRQPGRTDSAVRRLPHGKTSFPARPLFRHGILRSTPQPHARPLPALSILWKAPRRHSLSPVYPARPSPLQRYPSPNGSMPAAVSPRQTCLPPAPPLPQNFPSQPRPAPLRRFPSQARPTRLPRPILPRSASAQRRQRGIKRRRGCPFGTSPSVISISAWRPDAPFQTLSCRRDLRPACRRQRHPSHFPKETLRHDTGISAWLHGYGQWLW